jgi:hypothetical protein
MPRKDIKNQKHGQNMDTLGRTYVKDPRAAGEAHKNEQKRRAVSKWFRNFNRTKQKTAMSARDDVQYLNVGLFYLADITTGDPQTAFNNLIDECWPIAAKHGNMKDLDQTNEEPAYKLWMQAWTKICWEVAMQNNLRDFLDGVTEADDVPTTSTVDTTKIWIQASWDQYIQSLEKLDCPDFAIRFVNIFTWYIRMTSGYTRGTRTQIPPSYYLPFTHINDLNEMVAFRDIAKANKQYAMDHCTKFGIPFSKFSLDKLKCREIMRDQVFKDPTATCFFNMANMKYRNSSGVANLWHCTMLTGANQTTDYTNIRNLFDDTVPHSILRALTMLFGTYDATNNEYGGLIISLDTTATQYTIACRQMKMGGTTWTECSISNMADWRICSLYAGWYVGDSAQQLAWEGSAVSSNRNITLNQWLGYVENINIVDGNANVPYAEYKEACEQAITSLISGEDL